jgi:hypothetical protein
MIRALAFCVLCAACAGPAPCIGDCGGDRITCEAARGRFDSELRAARPGVYRPPTRIVRVRAQVTRTDAGFRACGDDHWVLSPSSREIAVELVEVAEAGQLVDLTVRFTGAGFTDWTGAHLLDAIGVRRVDGEGLEGQ